MGKDSYFPTLLGHAHGDRGYPFSRDMLFYEIGSDLKIAREKNFCFDAERSALSFHKTDYENEMGNRNYSRYYIIKDGKLVNNGKDARRIIKEITGVMLPLVRTRIGESKDNREIITRAGVGGREKVSDYEMHPSEMKMSSQAHALKERILKMPETVGLETVEEFVEKLPGILEAASKVAEKYEKEDEKQKKKYGFSVIPDAL